MKSLNCYPSNIHFLKYIGIPCPAIDTIRLCELHDIFPSAYLIVSIEGYHTRPNTKEPIGVHGADVVAHKHVISNRHHTEHQEV